MLYDMRAQEKKNEEKKWKNGCRKQLYIHALEKSLFNAIKALS